MKKESHIAELIHRRIKGTITPREQDELELWINEKPGNREIFEKAKDEKLQLEKLRVYSAFDRNKAWEGLDDKIFQTKTLNLDSYRFLRIAATILLPVLLLGGAGWFFFLKPDIQNFAELDNQIKPGTEKAILILSDGKEIILDETAGQEVIMEGKTQIRNNDKVLTYNRNETEDIETIQAFNELLIPKGGMYRLELEDGTKVWLNSGSSLKFPVAFNADAREVVLDGEGYFEVTHNNTPFIVHAGNMDVRVLGTSFNISAYSDDPEFRTTLVEGQVGLSTNLTGKGSKEEFLLKPDDQAVLNLPEKNLSIIKVNTSLYTSWTRGKIEFNNEDLEEVIKRLARWYNFSYEFKNEEARLYHFSARLDRDQNISSILEMIELTADVRFENNKGRILIY